MENKGKVLFVPHGGGPLPVLGHLGHLAMVKFLENFNKKIDKPDSIIVISAPKTFAICLFQKFHQLMLL